MQTMLTSDPSHAHPGAAALHPTCCATKQVPVAAQAAAVAKPQMLPLAQSASLLQLDPAGPPSATGAHRHVSHPLLSVRTPFGQLGKQPSAGHTWVGHDRTCHPQVPSEAIEHTGPPIEPSEQRTFGALGVGGPHTQTSPASATPGHAGNSHPHWPLASLPQTVRATDVPPGHAFASEGAGRSTQSVGTHAAPESALVPDPEANVPSHPLSAPARNASVRSNEIVPMNPTRGWIDFISFPLRSLSEARRMPDSA